MGANNGFFFGAGTGLIKKHVDQQKDATKYAANTAAAANDAAIQSVKDAQMTASSQAQEAINSKSRARVSSQSIYTSPLGLSTQASTAKKKLLGE